MTETVGATCLPVATVLHRDGLDETCQIFLAPSESLWKSGRSAKIQVIEAFPCFVLDEKHRKDRSKTTAGNASP
jgi:hypothetical protein